MLPPQPKSQRQGDKEDWLEERWVFSLMTEDLGAPNALRPRVSS